MSGVSIHEQSACKIGLRNNQKKFEFKGQTGEDGLYEKYETRWPIYLVKRATYYLSQI